MGNSISITIGVRRRCSILLYQSHTLHSHFLISHDASRKTTKSRDLLFALYLCASPPRVYLRIAAVSMATPSCVLTEFPLRVNIDFRFTARVRPRNGSTALARVLRHSPACKRSHLTRGFPLLTISNSVATPYRTRSAPQDHR